MKLRYSMLIIAVVGSLLIGPGAVLAHGDENTTNTEEERVLTERQTMLEEKRRQAEARLEQARAKKCEFVEARLTFHRDRAANIRDHRKERYQRIIDRLNALADRMDVNGLDSTALRAQIEKLTDLVAAYNAQFTVYEAALQDAINVVCDNEAVSKQTSAAAREALTALHANAESIHTFFQQELKPMLEDIREQIQAQKQIPETSEEVN